MANRSNIAGGDSRSFITQAELNAKASSKRELHRLLVSEAGLYISSYETTTVGNDLLRWINIFVYIDLSFERACMWPKEGHQEQGHQAAWCTFV